MPDLEGLDETILVDTIDDFADSPFADDAELLADDSLTSLEGAEPALIEGATDEQPDASRVVELPEQDESSLVGELLGSYWLWGTAGLVLLLALFFARRRKGAGDPDATGIWDDEDTGVGATHDQTIQDFSDLPSFDESIVVDEPNEAVVVDEVDEALAEDAAEPAEFQEPEAEPEAAPIFDASSEASLFDADDELPPDTGSSTASLEQLDESDAVAAQDDEVELPLEKTISTGAPLNLDQADPIAEAEFHMAYGLYDQAADLLVRALEDESDNLTYRVKLIEVYFVWENKEEFLEQAIILHEAIDDSSDSDWNKVLILGKQLCPDADLFVGVDAVAPTADSMDLELSDVGETEVDFSLGGTEIQALDENALDFDLGSDDSLEHDLALDLSEDGDATADGVDPDQTLSVDDDLAVTMESPTLDTAGFEAPTIETDMAASTMETPTLENPMIESTVDSPTLDIDLDDIEVTDAGDTLESPTLDVLGATSETSQMPALNEDSLTDPTSLDVDLSGLGDLPIEDEGLVEVDSSLNQLDNANEPLPQEDSGKTIPDDEATALSKTIDFEDVIAADTETSSDTVEQPQLERSDDGDTAEQPEMSIDDELEDMDAETQDEANPSDATMTEVGTKLDLARAYIDMGDPDGARSILKEVLDEGGDSQQQEARQLLEELED